MLIRCWLAYGDVLKAKAGGAEWMAWPRRTRCMDRPNPRKRISEIDPQGSPQIEIDGPLARERARGRTKTMRTEQKGHDVDQPPGFLGESLAQWRRRG